MFYYLRGKLALLQPDLAVVDCGGVGYAVTVSAATAGAIAGKAGDEVLLYTHFSLREDAADLYGFADEQELALFRKLISVSGVGPKAAMAILGALSADELASACAEGNYKPLTRAPGVGAKLAQRILLELKDKLPELSVSTGSGSAVGNAPAAGGKMSQIIDTLTLYGFQREQIRQAAKTLDPNRPLEELIADTLRILASDR